MLQKVINEMNERLRIVKVNKETKLQKAIQLQYEIEVLMGDIKNKSDELRDILSNINFYSVPKLSMSDNLTISGPDLHICECSICDCNVVVDNEQEICRRCISLECEF